MIGPDFHFSALGANSATIVHGCLDACRLQNFWQRVSSKHGGVAPQALTTGPSKRPRSLHLVDLLLAPPYICCMCSCKPQDSEQMITCSKHMDANILMSSCFRDKLEKVPLRSCSLTA